MQEATQATTEQFKAVDFSIEVPKPLPTGSRYVFTVADLLNSTVKDRNPDWAVGGVVIGESNCLKYRNGYVRRCEITELRQFMDSETEGNIDPTQRKHHPRRYELTQPNPITGRAEKLVIGNDDTLLRMPFYAGQEIERLTSQNDGLVEMPVKNNEEMRRAQLFLFENWSEIAKGERPLPIETAKLRAYFLKRLAVAREQDSDLFSKVAQAAVRSCDSFRGWCERTANSATVDYERSKAKGWGAPVGGDAVAAFEQSGLPRPDRIANDQSEKFERMTELMQQQAANQSKLIDLQIAQAQGKTPEPPELPAELPSEPVVEKVVEPIVDPGLKPEIITCLATTKSGSPCKNAAEDDGFCSREDHNADAEAAKAEAELKEAEASKEKA